jgi:hypothetical protein
MSLSQNRCALLGDMQLVLAVAGVVLTLRHRFSLPASPEARLSAKSTHPDALSSTAIRGSRRRPTSWRSRFHAQALRAGCMPRIANESRTQTLQSNDTAGQTKKSRIA